MKAILVDLKCPKCGYVTHKQSETLVFADFEEHVKKALEENTFFHYRCPQCGYHHRFFHSLLYIDKRHDFSLWISKESKYTGDMSEIKTQHNRIVSSGECAAEKIKIFEDDLNDNLIEEFKCQYRRDKSEIRSIYYQDIHEDNAWFIVNTEFGKEVIGVPRIDLQSELISDDQAFRKS